MLLYFVCLPDILTERDGYPCHTILCGLGLAYRLGASVACARRPTMDDDLTATDLVSDLVSILAW